MNTLALLDNIFIVFQNLLVPLAVSIFIVAGVSLLVLWVWKRIRVCMKRKRGREDKPESQIDYFHRDAITGILEQLVLSKLESEGPVFVGIEGRWGSGKTWIINEVRSRTYKRADFVTLHAELWGNESDLLSIWLGSIARHASGDTYDLDRATRKAVKKLSRIVSDIPIGSFSISLSSIFEDEENDVEEMRDTIHKYLAAASSKEKHTVLVLENLDRAPRDQLLSALRLLHFLFFEQPKAPAFKILIPYDRSVINHLLEKIAGRDFIEKFLEVSLALPKPTLLEFKAVAIRKLYESKIFSKQWDSIDENSRYLFADRFDISVSGFRSPRDLFQLVEFIRRVEDRCNSQLFLPDLLPLTAIRILDSDFYRALELNPSILYDRRMIRLAAELHAEPETMTFVDINRENFRQWVLANIAEKISDEAFDVLVAFCESALDDTKAVMRILAAKNTLHDFVSARRFFRLGTHPKEITEGEWDDILGKADSVPDFLPQKFRSLLPDGAWESFLERLCEERETVFEKGFSVGILGIVTFMKGHEITGLKFTSMAKRDYQSKLCQLVNVYSEHDTFKAFYEKMELGQLLFYLSNFHETLYPLTPDGRSRHFTDHLQTYIYPILRIHIDTGKKEKYEEKETSYLLNTILRKQDLNDVIKLIEAGTLYEAYRRDVARLWGNQQISDGLRQTIRKLIGEGNTAWLEGVFENL